ESNPSSVGWRVHSCYPAKNDDICSLIMVLSSYIFDIEVLRFKIQFAFGDFEHKQLKERNSKK
ncbi:MAG: hypothetical protein ABIJ28_02080, partial [Patescibacteria group bacterium]